jgi:adenylate kinase
MSEYSVNIVVGLSGVGKGTVLEEAMMLSDKDYEIINFGDKMVEVSKEKELVDHRDDLQELDSETYRIVQKEAAESIVEDSEDQNVIVDTHAAVKNPYGYIPGLPKWVVESLDPAKIIMLDASPEAIHQRIQSDSRDREVDSLEDIKEYREIAKKMASTDAVLTGAYLQIIENKDSQAEKAAEQLVDTLQG